MERRARIPALHACMILEVAARAGLDVDALQREAGLRLPIEPGLASSVSRAGHERLYEATARRLGDPLLSLRMGEVASGERFDLCGYALRSVGTVWDAVCLATHLHRRTSPHLWFDTERHRADWRWVIASPKPPADGWPRREIEYLLSTSLTAMEEITGRPVPVLEVRLGHPPGAPRAAYERRFRAPVRFSWHRSEILLPLEVADWTPPVRDPALSGLLMREILATVPDTVLLSSRARAHIEKALGADLDGGAVARALGMPVRTLQHRLRAEGTSYSGILDDVRRDRAVARVTDRATCIADVSYELGYRDVRSFHRAFRRWTGASPAAYRSGHGSRG